MRGRGVVRQQIDGYGPQKGQAGAGSSQGGRRGLVLARIARGAMIPFRIPDGLRSRRPTRISRHHEVLDVGTFRHLHVHVDVVEISVVIDVDVFFGDVLQRKSLKVIVIG